MAYTGYINKEVQAMYGIPYHQLTAEQKRILHADSVRRRKLIAEVQEKVLKNNLKAFDDEAKMEKVLGALYQNCQKQILADVAETIAKVKKAGGTWSYANQSALTRSRGLFEQITTELNKLGVQEQEVFTKGLSNIYTDQFLRQVYELGQSIPVKANFNRLNPALIKQTLDYPWSGAMFSDRLWLDKETLGRNLRAGLTQSMILGEGIPEITDRINHNINTSRYNAERVARTETKRVTYVAHTHAYEDTGVDELEYRVANGGDARVCSTCKKDNGTKYKRGEEPTLPRHPNCRCVYIPVVSDTFGDNELNELTGSIRGAENYKKWKETYAIAINPDGSYKDGWSMDFKTGKTTYTTDEGRKLTLEEYKKEMAKPLNNNTKTDKVSLSKIDPVKLTDYPQPFYATKAEAKNTQALMDFINKAEKADPDVVNLYRAMDKVYNLDDNGVAFKISHAKSHAVGWKGSRSSGKYTEVQLCIPKIEGDNIIGSVDTTLHEEMHLLDLLLSKDNRNGSRYGKYVSESNTKLVGTISSVGSTMGDKVKELFKKHDTEVDNIAKQMRDKFTAEHDKLYKKFLPNGLFGKDADVDGYKKATAKLKSTLDAEEDYLSRNVMGGGIHNLEDIYDALSGGTFRATGKVIYGHGVTYYSETGRRAKEILANYGTLSVAHPELLDILTEDKPELVSALREVIQEMLKEVK